MQNIRNENKGTLSAICITVFLVALNTISVKRFVDKFNDNVFQKENADFHTESVKRDSIAVASTSTFNRQLASWENAALSTQEAKAEIALAERRISAVKADTNKVAKSLRLENAKVELEKVKLKAFTNYEKRVKRPVKKEIAYAQLVNPNRNSSNSIWILSAFIGALLAGVEYAVIQKAVTGLPFMVIGLIYGGVLLYVHQAAMVFYFELPSTVGVGFSLLLTISAFLNYVQVSGQKLAGGVLYLSNHMKSYWKKLEDDLKKESLENAKLHQEELDKLDEVIKDRLSKIRAEKHNEFEEAMAKLEADKAIAINQIIRDGHLRDAENSEKSVDKFFEIEKRFDRFGDEFKPVIRKAFTQRLLTMNNSMTQLPDHIAEKPYTNGKPIHPHPAPVSKHFDVSNQRFTLEQESELLMPPRGEAVTDADELHVDDITDETDKPVQRESNVGDSNELPETLTGKKKMSDAEILADARERKADGEKMTVSNIGKIYSISHRQAYKIFRMLG